MIVTAWMGGLVVAAVVAADTGGMADPTRPVDYLPMSALTQPLPEELVDWRLTAVRIGKDDSSAVLNGRIVRTGDQVGRARVVEIRPGIVVVDFDRRRVEVRLFSGDVHKQKAKQSDASVTK